MRNIVYMIGVIGVLAGIFAAATFVGPRMRVDASTISQSGTAAAARSGISPFELTVQHGRNLPAENWDAF